MVQNSEFHLLSFEGPDPYSRAGGIASRISGLAHTLAELGFETHLWFIGDPGLPGHETRGRLHLHRWCQWLSRLAARGVYDDEEGKRRDYVRSLPPQLFEMLLPRFAEPGFRPVVLAEEWQTVHAVLHLDWLLKCAGRRERVTMLWNANNVFGFDEIDWERLKTAATITTVSRYMRHRMWQRGVDAQVIPNGLVSGAFDIPDRDAVRALRSSLHGRTALTKIARWDPDKRWLLAVDTVAALKRSGRKPLLIARGGLEAHGDEVLARARAHGLRIADRSQDDDSAGALLASLGNVDDVDLINLRSPLSAAACRALYRASGAVLVNSGHEPFGLVGLESMAVGGVTCVGGTGEDYALAGWNALVLQSDEPEEFVRQYARVGSDPAEERALRRRAIAGARRFTWEEVVRRSLLPQVGVDLPSAQLPVGRTARHAGDPAVREALDYRIPLAAQPAQADVARVF